MCLNAIELDPGGKRRIAQHSLPNELRRALELRQNDLTLGLTPCDRIDAAEAVLLMFDAWPGARMDASKTKGVAIAYTNVLRDLPIWAIRAGVADCQKRNDPFPPSAGELLAASERRVKMFRDEARDISAVLNAEIFSPNKDKSEAAMNRVREAAKRLGARPGSRVSSSHRSAGVEMSSASQRLAESDYASRPPVVSAELAERLS